MSDRHQALVYALLVLVVSWAFEAFIILNGGVARFGVPALVMLMWIPGLLSILMRLVLNSGFGDAGFVPGDRRYYLYAILIPLALALVTGLVCTILDIRQFSIIDSGLLLRSSPMFLALLAFGLFGAFGEELGWRGFLLPKMVSGGIRHPYLATGVVWAAWHVPLIAFGGFYATDSILPMVAAYSCSILAINFVISEFRMRSGSVWIATLFHASHNFFFQVAVPAMIFAAPGARSGWWEIIGGDSGFTVALLYGFAFLLMIRKINGVRLD